MTLFRIWKKCFLPALLTEKNEKQISLSLGSPKEAARSILLEKGISISAGGTLAKAVIFAVITTISMYYLWDRPFESYIIMPIIPMCLLFVMGNGSITGFLDNKPSVLSILSCVIPIISIFLFANLTDAVLWGNDSALLPISAAITAVTAVSLVCTVLSVKVNLFGIIVPAVGLAAVLSIAVLQINATLRIIETYMSDQYADYETAQIMYRSRYLNVFVATLFISGIIIFIISVFRRDRASMTCMYAVLGILTILSGERGVLRLIDLSDQHMESIISYIPKSLVIEAAVSLIISLIVSIILTAGKAKKNG